LPTPPFFVVEKLPVPPSPFPWPVIVKPALQDASVGVDQGSVVTNQDQLSIKVEAVLARYGPPVLVERFIEGREFNVALIETPDLRALPVSEILFLEKDASYWPIVTYDAKWKTGSRECQATPSRCPAEIDAALAERLMHLARQAYRLTGCRDYARVDFRVSESNEPFLLEVNPNPDFSPDAGFASSLRAAGLTQAQLAVDLVRQAAARVLIKSSILNSTSCQHY